MCSARFVNQMHRLRSVSLLACCTLGRSQELRGGSTYPYLARFPDMSVFKDAQDVVRGIVSVLPPKKQSVLIDPRYILLMLRPQLGHAFRRLRFGFDQATRRLRTRMSDEPCAIDSVLGCWLAIFTTIHSGVALLATVVMDRVPFFSALRNVRMVR